MRLVFLLLASLSLNAAIPLPIEVLGPIGTIESIALPVPRNTVVDGLWMQIHGATRTDKISVAVNGGDWIDLNNSTVQVEQPAKAYGGIGGGFNTVTMTLPLATNIITRGLNIITWRHNENARQSIGFRVLEVNLTSNGEKIIPDYEFVHDDPRQWRPPLSDTNDIAVGRNLWFNRDLSGSKRGAISAKCTDCHA